MREGIIEDTHYPLVVFLRDVFHQLATCFNSSGMYQQVLNETLQREVQKILHSTSDPSLRLILLTNCQMIPQLGPKTLRAFLHEQGLPPAHFLSEPPSAFDSVLVSVGTETVGSGFIWYFSNRLTPNNVYYLLAHVYGHLALGHLQKGDENSHYDILSALQTPSGPTRRWDREVQQWLPHWFEPLPVNGSISMTEDGIEWEIPGVAEAFERLCNHRVDEITLLIQAIIAHYDTQLLYSDFDIFREAELFPHQQRGALELAMRLQKLGVALLADSVGLGKTRTTATLIKMLLQHNIIKQAAVLTPSKLEHNWREELAKLHLKVASVNSDSAMNADVLLVNKDIFNRIGASEARQQVRSCDLLVVEEAHQGLRNNKNRFYQNIREVAFDKYGLLVTATPWNNRRGDIFTMLYPFASNIRGKERPMSAFRCFSQSFRSGLQMFEQDTVVFRQVYGLTALQRTRRQLRESGDTSVFYAPRRPYLVEVVYTSEQRRAFATLLEKLDELRLPHFNPLRSLFASDEQENHLSGIQRFTLLKRAESSMVAFERSLTSVAAKAASLRRELGHVADDDASIAQWLRQRYSSRKEEGINDDMNWETTTDLSLRINARQARINRLIDIAERMGQLRSLRETLVADCHNDEQVIHSIQHDFGSLFMKDPKIEQILTQIRTSVASGHKVLCISQFADTVIAVYQQCLQHAFLRQRGVGLVMSSSQQVSQATQINGYATSREEVLRRFAPRSWTTQEKKRRKRASNDEQLPASIDILVGTDTLSVGQNLQDARVLINLDLCWNPMLHEQRIGRIDRPRHQSDLAPLDIFYFLNLDLIESELRLRVIIDQRLTATYQDTAFDDEIFPGYFDMIENFRRLHKEQEPDTTYVAEADALLEAIAEKNVRPADIASIDNEQELAALLRLQTFLNDQDQRVKLEHVRVNIGYIPLTDHHGLLRTNLPQAALIAEVSFQPQDKAEHPVGPCIYRRFALELHTSMSENQQTPSIMVEGESLVPIADGLLSEPTSRSLSQLHITRLATLLHALEDVIAQEQHVQEITQKRVKRYQRIIQIDMQVEQVAIHRVHAQLTALRFLV